uniref:Fucosyltransferase n=1 Tax=Rhabditophanes sp. KR3021 TaxID=114890 RepID=A0AC35U6P6_9BILA
MNRPEERRIKTTKSEIETLRSDFDDQLPTIRNRENPQELFVKKETSLGSRFKKAEKFVAKKSGTLKESIQRPLTGLFRKNVEDRRSMVNRTAVEEGNVDVVHAFSDDMDDMDEKAEIARLENEESLRKIDQIINKMLGNAHEESPKNSNFNEPLQFDALQKDFGENIMVGDIAMSNLFLDDTNSVQVMAEQLAETPLIVLWTPIFGDQKASGFNCPTLGCVFTTDKQKVVDADSVVFHFSDINMSSLPSRSKTTQKFVYLTQETSFSTTNYPAPHHFFDWIMSYHSGSDVLMKYGSYWVTSDTPNKMNLETDKQTILSNKKNKGIIGFISNCFTNSVREYYIKKLRDYMTIDVYGKCADDPTKPNICSDRNDNCDKEVMSTYYFYFALENSLCPEYITEKYWVRYGYDSVPIVMKREFYEHFLPKNSFIALDDYKGAKEMADHLSFLMENDDEYMKYFAYRSENLTVMNHNELMKVSGYCALCKKLITSLSSQQETTLIPDVKAKFEKMANCIPQIAALATATHW